MFIQVSNIIISLHKNGENNIFLLCASNFNEIEYRENLIEVAFHSYVFNFNELNSKNV